jgi:hypothetical protein
MLHKLQQVCSDFFGCAVLASVDKGKTNQITRFIFLNFSILFQQNRVGKRKMRY